MLWTYLHLQQMCLTGSRSLTSTTTQNRLCFERGLLAVTAERVYYLLLQTRERVLIISPAKSLREKEQTNTHLHFRKT